MKLAPLTESTRRAHIVRSLRALIVSGTVPAGERLTESALSAQLGVSRAPLREAIRELVSCGLLVSQPYRGLFVRGFTRKDLLEIYSLRTTLERMAFREAWDRRTPAALADLDTRHAALLTAMQGPPDPARSIELELDLHSWVYELSGHRLLIEAWERLCPNIQFYFAMHQKAHARARPRRKAHEDYVSLARGRDLGKMLDHLEEHLRLGLEKTMSYIGDAEQGAGANPAAGKTAKSNNNQQGD